MPKPYALMNLEKGERFYKFFFFRPRAGRHKRFEYRIFTKEKADGKLALVAYNFKIENGVTIKDHVTEVPEMPKDQLLDIVQGIKQQTLTMPDEFEEVDLSRFKTVDEQTEFLKTSGRADVSYLH